MTAGGCQEWTSCAITESQTRLFGFIHDAQNSTTYALKAVGQLLAQRGHGVIL
jgi:hypothetical protein